MARVLAQASAIVVALAAFPVTVSAESGIASSYPHSYQGRRTANGERFNPQAMTCAHKRHPFGSVLRVSTGQRAISCRVTDRGPFVRGRVIDITPAGARALGISGLGKVTVVRM
ncbi:MAG: septal ring lytic transglycosylase RlpA family protein [Xanthobacteraceae bacterium]